MFAGFDARAIHEFAIADAIAAFDLDLFDAQHRRRRRRLRAGHLLASARMMPGVPPAATGFSGLPQIRHVAPRNVVNAPGQGCRPRMRL